MELLENLPVAHKKVNIKKEIGKYLRLWPWFLISMLLFYTAAKVYLRYAQPKYLTKTALKLQESKNKNTTLSDMRSLGVGVSDDSELQGETTVIVSKPILTQVAEKLNLNVTFYGVGKIKEVELYQDSPLSAQIISLDNPSGFWGATYTIEPQGKRSFILKELPGKVFPLGAPVKLPFGTAVIHAKPGYTFAGPIKIVFQNIKSVVSGLEGAINVNLPPNKGLLMELSLVGAVPQKSEDILNEIANQYNIDGIKDKNLEAQNTQDFINDRLEIISQDLSGIEGRKESFKRQNQIVDLESQANMSLANANENTKAVLGYATQLNLINSVYAAASGSDQLLPSNMGMPAGVEGAITQYNDLVLTRNRVLKQATTANPAIIEMNKEIASLKNLIRKNLAESRETLQLQIAQLQAQTNVEKSRITKYPTQEKVFRDIERQQNLKEQLYLYLLQKREENAITLAVKLPKAKIVNPAYTTGIVQPNYKMIETAALGVGFLLPLLFFFGRNTLDTKVHSKEHITAYFPDAKILSEIPVTTDENGLVSPNDFSVFAESFRILASNLKFLLKAKTEKDGGVILVTSSVKGEGKTTVAMNTALTLAGKNKVIIIGADIRNPQLQRFVNSTREGLTDFLVSDSSEFGKYIVKSGLSDNLDVLFSGAIAPNPNDLLDMKKFDDLVADLAKQYKYVIIDSAPVMLVSDTLNLLKNSDVVLYVVKSDSTEKEMIGFAKDFRNNNDVNNMAFVLNSVKPENTRYGKKYGYGYYSYGNEVEKRGWRKFF